MKYDEFVKSRIKPGIVILNELTSSDCNIIHMLMGLTGEVGELTDAIKKYIIYQQPINYNNLIEELGDIEFYMEGLRRELKINRKDCLETNMIKLSERYHEGKYSDQQAQERKDKS